MDPERLGHTGMAYTVNACIIIQLLRDNQSLCKMGIILILHSFLLRMFPDKVEISEARAKEQVGQRRKRPEPTSELRRSSGN